MTPGNSGTSAIQRPSSSRSISIFTGYPSDFYNFVEWADCFPAIFSVTDGTLGTAVLNGPELGF